MSIEFPDCVQVKKTLYNHTQAAATAGNILKFLIKFPPFYLLFTLELLLQLGSEGMVQII